ncbi:mechanosensitive ion channel family protein [Salinibaculum salinum]|uniref:mechanosensitive ion channel family protein n=1 Tax=Salinibaculum salinum TaxID=3131996 RepID=UPI0030EB2555
MLVPLSNQVVFSQSDRLLVLQIEDEVTEPFAPFTDPVADLVVFLVVAVVVYTLSRMTVAPVVYRAVRARNPDNRTLVTATETYFQLFLLVVASFVGIVLAGYGGVVFNTDSALVVAALTFSIGVAGQEVLGSLVSGFFLILDPDFNVGDSISWPGGNGVVEAVDFRVTRVRTVDNATVTVPNTELATNALTRPFGGGSYRLTERVHASHDIDIERALLELQQVAAAFHQSNRQSADVDVDTRSPDVRVVDLGADNITIEAEVWLDNPTQHDLTQVRSDFNREIKRRFDEEGIQLDPPSGRELSGSITVDGDRGV